MLFTGSVGKCGFGHQWTKWYDAPPNARGDDETLTRIKKAESWSCSSKPSAIEARLAKSNRPYVAGSNRLKYISPKKGLLCLHSKQDKGEKCQNYKVRFCCLQLINISTVINSVKTGLVNSVKAVENVLRFIL